MSKIIKNRVSFCFSWSLTASIRNKHKAPFLPSWGNVFEKFINHITNIFNMKDLQEKVLSYLSAKKVFLSSRYSMSFPYRQHKSYFPFCLGCLEAQSSICRLVSVTMQKSTAIQCFNFSDIYFLFIPLSFVVFLFY